MKNSPKILLSIPSKKLKQFLMTMMLTLGFLTLLNSCKKSSESQEVVLDKNLLKSEKKYKSLLDERDNGKPIFEIKDIKRIDDKLHITVKGGCKAEDFQIVWDGEILLSYPAQVNLLIFNSSATTCGTDKEFNVEVNLKKMIEKPDSNGYVFHVANGSIKRDKSLNPDGSVSSN